MPQCQWSNLEGYILMNLKERNKTKHNNTVCIFDGMYSVSGIHCFTKNTFKTHGMIQCKITSAQHSNKARKWLSVQTFNIHPASHLMLHSVSISKVRHGSYLHIKKRHPSLAFWWTEGCLLISKKIGYYNGTTLYNMTQLQTHPH